MELTLTPHTYQALLWLADGPKTTADLVRLQHLPARSARRRLGYLVSAGLAQKSGETYSTTDRAITLMRGEIS